MDQRVVMLKRNWKLIAGALGIVLVIWFLSRGGDGSSSSHKTTYGKRKQLLPLKGEEISDKWIVVTSINPPTDAIKVFASQEGWRTVVVGDTKSPEDWEYENCTFLGVEKQKKLGYEVYNLLPFKSYARKNIGYLYAIQHGAKVIYESDDDNIPTNGIISIPEETKIQSYVYEEDKIAVNVYAHFGRPDVWPRGFPLNQIKPATRETSEPKKTKASTKLVPIQQGLANGDPDVDAIYRLTQPLKIIFDDSDPISIPEGMMCPWNSQNTFFHESAFWGTLIPITTTFRVCDIWRSYWVQRILWDIGGELAFLPASVEQIRNPHDYLEDFKDEIDLYVKAEKLIRFLIEWESHANNIPDRIVQLAQGMADNEFWKQGDAELVKAWVSDLSAVGYEFPEPV